MRSLYLIHRRKRYDCKEDADSLDFISNPVVGAFGILGSVDNHLKKLKELEKIGATQFTFYLMYGEEDSQVAENDEHIIPNSEKQSLHRLLR